MASSENRTAGCGSEARLPLQIRFVPGWSRVDIIGNPSVQWGCHTMKPKKNFGEHLRELRHLKGVGLKSAAPALGVSYSYLSKLENEKASPSEELLVRLASYYQADSDELFFLADRIPDDVRGILRENPRLALAFLRERFGGPGPEQRE